MPKLVNEIATKVFTRVFRGYDEKEVDTFLDDLMVEIDEYEREIEKLRREAVTKPAYCATVNGHERAGEQTLATAQQMKSARELMSSALDDAKRIVDNASDEAELIVADGKAQAEAILQDANDIAEERVRQANEEAEAILNESRRSATFHESISQKHDAEQEGKLALNDPIRELSQRLQELQERLGSIEVDNSKVVDIKQGNSHDTSIYRSLDPGKDQEGPAFSAFGKEEFRTSTNNPWNDWLPGTSIEHPQSTKEVQNTDGIRDDWNFTD